jgi:hypothetical protein
MPRPEERPTPDPETVRETMRERDDEQEDQGPDVEELSDDPAYEPDDERLKGIKGG